MSITLDYFFNYDGDAIALANEVNQILGVSFTSQNNKQEDLTAHFLGMNLSLGVHEYEDDLGIPFESFRYCVGAKTFWPDADLRQLQVVAIASLPYLLFKHLRITGLLVYELQRIVAQYQVRLDEDGDLSLWDILSNTPANKLEHWQAVFERITS